MSDNNDDLTAHEGQRQLRPGQYIHAEDRVLPGHPVKAGAGYDCACGGCLALPVRRAEYEAEWCRFTLERAERAEAKLAEVRELVEPWEYITPLADKVLRIVDEEVDHG